MKRNKNSRRHKAGLGLDNSLGLNTDGSWVQTAMLQAKLPVQAIELDATGQPIRISKPLKYEATDAFAAAVTAFAGSMAPGNTAMVAAPVLILKGREANQSDTGAEMALARETGLSGTGGSGKILEPDRDS